MRRVVIEMVDDLADRVVRTFGFPFSLFSCHVRDRVLRGNEPAVLVIALRELSDQSSFLIHRISSLTRASRNRFVLFVCVRGASS